MKYSLIFVFFFSALLCRATVRVTVCNGTWNTPEVWEDSIIPGQGDTIRIRHFVTLTTDLTFDDNMIYIEPIAKMCGYDTLVVDQGSKIYNYGFLSVYTFMLEDSVINKGGALEAKQFVISGYLVMEGGYLMAGDYRCFERQPCVPGIYWNRMDSIFCNTTGVEFKWYKDGQRIASVQQGARLKGNGMYTVQSGDGMGNFSEMSDAFVYTFSGINDPEEEGQLLYPNPNDGRFTFKAVGKGRLSVYNINGSMVFDEQINNINDYYELPLTSGTYMVSFNGENGNSTITRMVVR